MMEPRRELNRAVDKVTGWLNSSKTSRPGSDTDLRGLVTLITGGSRGLGLLLAREFAREGCKLVICARDAEELESVRQDFEAQGTEILAIECDVADQSQVEQMINRASDHFGRIDILVNNASIIQVGPVETMTLQNFEDAMKINFWGTLYTSLAVLPQMKERRNGRIVNVTSIGGKVGISHLLPYSAAKFAATGFSEGLRSELTGTGVSVTTIVPGLLRTGSYLNVPYKGKQTEELTWFALGDNLPLVSMDAERAARQIVEATRRRESERTLSLPAVTLALIHGLAPGLTADLYGVITRLMLPKSPGPSGQLAARGMELNQKQEAKSPLWTVLTGLGLSAARRLNQYPGPLSVLSRTNNKGEMAE